MKGNWISTKDRLPPHDPVYGQTEFVLGACKIEGEWVFEVERFCCLYPTSLHQDVPYWDGIDMQFPDYWHPITKPRKSNV